MENNFNLNHLREASTELLAVLSEPFVSSQMLGKAIALSPFYVCDDLYELAVRVLSGPNIGKYVYLENIIDEESEDDAQLVSLIELWNNVLEDLDEEDAFDENDFDSEDLVTVEDEEGEDEDDTDLLSLFDLRVLNIEQEFKFMVSKYPQYLVFSEEKKELYFEFYASTEDEDAKQLVKVKIPVQVSGDYTAYVETAGGEPFLLYPEYSDLQYTAGSLEDLLVVISNEF